MRLIVAICLFVAAAGVTAAQTDSWYSGWPPGVETAGQKHQIPAQHIGEIPHSLFKSAEDLLAKEPAVLIGNKYFGPSLPNCPESTHAYLVRAVYEHGGTGTFEVYSVGKTLLVRHYALGAHAKPQRSALFACLPFKPEHVYVATGGAM
jgi:hypothetical protein